MDRAAAQARSSGSGKPATKPVSKLQRRIQAGQMQSARVSGPPVGAPDVDPVPSEARSLVRDFTFPAPPPDLFATPSAFAAALPSPAKPDRLNLPRRTSFPQPATPSAFLEPSPDHQVLLARQGTSLGIQTRTI